ncbi:GtrA family protein [Halalkaliarchaeum desulfuricum]|uniref:GtrA family protein n=1 Tax=Halalkaliarchaeum desulfuricum TaxID=2055893 RepID=A0A343TKY1_9EURY|nr:GtrA family protein [Halalkaliarchaeum desulfuricum]
MIGAAVRELATADRFGKFLSVGAAGAVLDLSVSSALTIGGIPPEYAKVVGAECAIIVMFFINDRWTFPEHGESGIRSTGRRLLKSNVVRSGGLVVQFLVVRTLTRLDVSVVVAGTDVWAFLTFPIAIACAFVFNYTAESLVTWRVLRDR